MKNVDIDILEHIRNYCSDIQNTVERFGNDKTIFESDRDFRNSVCMSLLQIGELTEEQILYLNFEDYDYSFIRSGKDLHEYVKGKIVTEKKYYLFFDEIQTVPEFERVVNSIRMKFDTSIFITGSNGKLLSGELATYLSGRNGFFEGWDYS